VEFKLNWEITLINIEIVLIMSMIFQIMFFIIRNSGPTFCQVSINIRFFHEILLDIDINQMWNGARATLIIRANVIIITGIMVIIFDLIFISFIINPNSKIIEDMDLISNKIHNIIQVFDDTSIIGVRNNVVRKIRFGKLIYKEFFYQWGMSPLALFSLLYLILIFQWLKYLSEEL
jgi:hypothetical protein